MHWFLVKLMALFSTKCFQAKRKGPSALPELTSLGCGLSNVTTITTTAQCWTSLKKDQHEDLDLLTLTQIQIANFINKNFSWKGLLSRFSLKDVFFTQAAVHDVIHQISRVATKPREDGVL